MTTPIGIVCLSFGKRKEAYEPGPVNQRLAKVAEDIKLEFSPAVVVAQWEIARQLEQDGTPADLVVNLRNGSWRRGVRYLDTDDVLHEAFQTFRHRGIKRVIVVAHPFYHLGSIQEKVRNAGFLIQEEFIPDIEMDNSNLNLQWWTRNKLLFLVYGGLVTVADKVHVDLHGIGERKAT